MIKGAILGLGFIGKVHFEAFEKLNNTVSLEACFDITEKNFEGVNNVRKYTDLDEFFEKGYILKDQYRFIAVNEKGEEKDLNADYDENLMYQNEIKYFAKIIRNDEMPKKCLPSDSANAIKIVLAEIESAERSGKMIYF